MSNPTTLTITIESLEGDIERQRDTAYQLGREANRLEKAFKTSQADAPIFQTIRNLRTIEQALLDGLAQVRAFKVIGVAKDDKSTRDMPNPATDYKSLLFTEEEADDYVARNESPDNFEEYEIEVAS